MSLDLQLKREKKLLNQLWESYVDEAAKYIHAISLARPPEFYKELVDLFQRFKVQYYLQLEREANGPRELIVEHETVPRGLWKTVYTLPGAIVSIKADRLTDLVDAELNNNITGMKIRKKMQTPQDIQIIENFGNLEKLTFYDFNKIDISTVLPKLKEVVVNLNWGLLETLNIPIAPALERVTYIGNLSLVSPRLLIPQQTELGHGFNYLEEQGRLIVERYEK